jgi:hypothetical protein
VTVNPSLKKSGWTSVRPSVRRHLEVSRLTSRLVAVLRAVSEVIVTWPMRWTQTCSASITALSAVTARSLVFTRTSPSAMVSPFCTRTFFASMWASSSDRPAAAVAPAGVFASPGAAGGGVWGPAAGAAAAGRVSAPSGAVHAARAIPTSRRAMKPAPMS